MATGERLIDDEELCALGSVAQTLIPILDPFLQEEGLELAGPEHSILALPLTQHGLLLLVDPAPR